MVKWKKKMVSIILIIIFFTFINNDININAMLLHKNDIKDISEFVNNEIIVHYKNNNKKNNSLMPLCENSEQISDNIVLLKVKDKFMEETIDGLLNDNNVSYIQPNYKYELLNFTNDTYFSKQWSLYNDGTFSYSIKSSTQFGKLERVTSLPDIDIKAHLAWDNFDDSGRDVKIALIDTGIEYTHDDLKNSMWINKNEIPDDGIDNDNNGYIDDVYGWNFIENNNKVFKNYYEDSHATHCAGIIGAEKNNNIGIAGIASSPKIKLMSVKALLNQGGGTTISVCNAIKYAESMGANICNLSMGYSGYDDNNKSDKMLYDTINNSNMLFIIAAGNGDAKDIGIDNDTSKLAIYPASFDCDNIISVANLSFTGQLNTSSNYGKTTVDIAAPGTAILSTVPDNEYDYMSGTSMAAPMVTAVAAMVYSKYTDISLKGVKQVILDTVTVLPTLQDKVASCGILNAYAALNVSDVELLNYDNQAPRIKLIEETIEGSYTKFININVTDSNLKTIKYDYGEHDIDYFYENGDTIENNSKIKVVSSGIYTVYAVDKNGNSSIEKIVINIYTNPTQMYLEKYERTLKVGNTYRLKVNILPLDAITQFTYTTSNKNVAIVNKNGKVKAKSKGTAIITIKSSNGLAVQCKIKVKNVK